jgi:hypothetical protein
MSWGHLTAAGLRAEGERGASRAGREVEQRGRLQRSEPAPPRGAPSRTISAEASFGAPATPQSRLQPPDGSDISSTSLHQRNAVGMPRPLTSTPTPTPTPTPKPTPTHPRWRQVAGRAPPGARTRIDSSRALRLSRAGGRRMLSLGAESVSTRPSHACSCLQRCSGLWQQGSCGAR